MDASAAVHAYLGTVDQGTSLARQRRWALTGLLEHATAAGPCTADGLLDPDVVAGWLDAARAAGASTAGLRARAAAARALAAFLSAHRLSAPATVCAPLPAPDPAPADAARGRALLAAAGDGPPPQVPAPAWYRFAAYVHVVGVSGAPERVVAALRVDDVDVPGRGVAVPAWVDLPAPAARALAAWETVRTQVCAHLAGGPPSAWWVTVGPSRGGKPAGLPVGARGLRKAFRAAARVLGELDPALAGVSIRDVRAAAGTWPT